MKYKVTFLEKQDELEKLLSYRVKPFRKEVTFIGGEIRLTDAIYEYMRLHPNLYVDEITPCE